MIIKRYFRFYDSKLSNIMNEAEQRIRVQITGLENVLSDENAYLDGLRLRVKHARPVNLEDINKLELAQIALLNARASLIEVTKAYDRYLQYMKEWSYQDDNRGLIRPS